VSRVKLDRNFLAGNSIDLIAARITVRYLLNEIEIGARTHSDTHAPVSKWHAWECNFSDMRERYRQYRIAYPY